jgi:hypothetical protein
MDAQRSTYQAPVIESTGSVVARTAKMGGKPNSDVALTGQFAAEGSLGFLL